MSGTNISFVNTPPNTRNPGFYFEVNAQNANTGVQPKQCLIIGPVGPGVTATNQAELAPSVSYAKATYGVSSVLALMVGRYRKRDIYGAIYTLPVSAVAGGTTGQIAVTFTGPCTAAGTLSGYVCDHLVQVTVTVGMTAAQVATAFAAAVNALLVLPMTVPTMPTAAVVTLVANTPGALDYDCRFNKLGSVGGEAYPAGISATTVFTPGTGTPALANALANVSGKLFDIIITAYTDTTSLQAISAFLSDATGRWAPTVKLFGHAFGAVRATLSQATTLSVTMNDQHRTILPVDNSPTPAWLIAADMAGSIANPIRNDPSLPVQKIAMGWSAPPLANQFDFPERDVLLAEGMSTYEVQDDGTVLTSRLITTYQFNSYGIADDSFLDVETPFQLAEIIQFYDSEFSSNLTRKRLLQNGSRFGAADPNTITPQILETYSLALYRQLMAKGRVQDDTTFAQLCTATIVGEGRVNLLLPITLADQLRIVAALVTFTKP